MSLLGGDTRLTFRKDLALRPGPVFLGRLRCQDPPLCFVPFFRIQANPLWEFLEKF